MFGAMAPSNKTALALEWLSTRMCFLCDRLVGLYDESELEPSKEPCQRDPNPICIE